MYFALGWLDFKYIPVFLICLVSSLCRKKHYTVQKYAKNSICILNIKITINHIWKWESLKAQDIFLQGKSGHSYQNTFRREADKLFLPVPKNKTPLTSLHIAKQLKSNWCNLYYQYKPIKVLYILHFQGILESNVPISTTTSLVTCQIIYITTAKSY